MQFAPCLQNFSDITKVAGTAHGACLKLAFLHHVLVLDCTDFRITDYFVLLDDLMF